MSPESMYVNTASLRVITNTVADDGSYSHDITIGDSFPCSIQPLSSSESIQYERQASGEFARLYCDPSVSITAESEIVDESSVVWRVVGRPRNTGGRSEFQTIDLERTK